MAACTQPGRPGASGRPGQSESSSQSAGHSLGPSSDQPIPTDALTGVIGADAVEGGCGYLQADDGTRYEVLYPEGWQLQLDPLELRSPDGSVVARGGDEITVRGMVTTEMASICQLGPIFQATEVVTD